MSFKQFGGIKKYGNANEIRTNKIISVSSYSENSIVDKNLTVNGPLKVWQFPGTDPTKNLSELSEHNRGMINATSNTPTKETLAGSASAPETVLALARSGKGGVIEPTTFEVALSTFNNSNDDTASKGQADFYMIGDYFGDSGQKVMTLRNDKSAFFYGNVGVGTTNPTTQVDVSGAVQVSEQFIVKSQNDNNPSLFISVGSIDNVNNAVYENDRGDGGHLFQTNSGGTIIDAMFISSNGNVGVDTTEPTEKLDVSGNINMNSNKIINVADPLNNQDAATKAYVDNVIANSNNSRNNSGNNSGNIPTDYVDLSSNQNIQGIKTFSNDTILSNIRLIRPSDGETNKAFINVDQNGNIIYTNDSGNGDYKFFLNNDGTVQELFRLNSKTFKIDCFGEINMNSNKIINVVDPLNNQDAATKAYVDNLINNIDLNEYVNLSSNQTISGEKTFSNTNGINAKSFHFIRPSDGNTSFNQIYIDTTDDIIYQNLSSGAKHIFQINQEGQATPKIEISNDVKLLTGINMNAYKIENVANPTEAQDVTNKEYVDNNFLQIDGSNAMLNNLNLSGKRIINLSDPLNDNEAATKAYVDNVIANSDISGNIPTDYVDLSSNQNIQGIKTFLNDTILSNIRLIRPSDGETNKAFINVDQNGNIIYTNYSGNGDYKFFLNNDGTVQELFRLNADTFKIDCFGEINMNSNKIINVTDPSNNQDAATKAYVDNLIANSDISGNYFIKDEFMRVWQFSGSDPTKSLSELSEHNRGMINVTSNTPTKETLAGSASAPETVLALARSGKGGVINPTTFEIALSTFNNGSDTASKGQADFYMIGDYSGDSGQKVMTLRNDKSAFFYGNVGIGTTEPTEKLDVSGNININSDPIKYAINLQGGNKKGILFASSDNENGSNISHSSGWSMDYKAGPGDSDSGTGSHNFYTSIGGAGGAYRKIVSIDSDAFQIRDITDINGIIEMKTNSGVPIIKTTKEDLSGQVIPADLIISGGTYDSVQIEYNSEQIVNAPPSTISMFGFAKIRGISVGSDSSFNLSPQWDGDGEIRFFAHSGGTAYSRLFCPDIDQLTLIGSDSSYNYIDNPASFNVHTLNAITKNFKIPHPILEDTDLYHSSVESSTISNMYTGHATFNNSNIVELNMDIENKMTEGTWIKLNRNPKIFIQNNDSFNRCKAKINGNVLTIECECITNDKVDWMVVVERCDKTVINSKTTDKNGVLITEVKKIDSV